jgi:hypothetical protein
MCNPNNVCPIYLNWDFPPSIVNRTQRLFPSQFRFEVGGARETEGGRDPYLSVLCF